MALFVERHIKTDVTYAARGGLWLSLDNLASMATAFVLMLAFGNLVASETYGTYRYILSIYSFLAIFGMAGFNTAVTRAVAKNLEGEFWRGFKIKFLGSLLGSAISFAVACYYFMEGNADLGRGLFLIGFILPFLESSCLHQYFLNGKKEFRFLALSLASSQIFAMFSILAAIFLGADVFWLLFAYFVGWLSIKLFFTYFVFKKFRPNNLKGEKTIKLGANITFLTALETISSYLDRIVLFHFFGPVELAMYSFAIAPVEQAKGILKNIYNLTLPRFSQRTEDLLQKTMVKKMLLLACGAAIMVLGYIILAPIFYKIFLPKYVGAIALSQIFAISLMSAAAIAPSTAIQAIPKIKAMYFYEITTPLISIGLVLVLIPLYGLWGAIIARVLGRLSGVVISYLTFRFL